MNLIPWYSTQENYFGFSGFGVTNPTPVFPYVLVTTDSGVMFLAFCVADK